MQEPVLNADDIQGAIAPGFKLPYHRLVALRVRGAAGAQTLAALLPRVTTMREVALHHRARIALAVRTGSPGAASFALARERRGAPLKWLAVAVGADLLADLGEGAPAAVERSFKIGLDRRSFALGDPRVADDPGHRSNWLVGGPSTKADLLLTLGSDEAAALDAFSQEIEAQAQALGATILYARTGNRLPNEIEHFGFRDGVSQPAIRGRLSDDPDDFLIRRKLETQPAKGPELAAPGEELIWPGEFIFGYQRQSPNDFRLPLPEATIDPFLRNGSFLVFRHLQQDVPAFRTATSRFAEDIAADPRFPDVDEARARALLVGRWPSGAPLSRYPDTDPGGPPGSDWNHFGFDRTGPDLTLLDGTRVAGAEGDPTGVRCPHFAHIRQVNPRDRSTDEQSTQTQTRRLLRRGITFGPAYDDAPDIVERGLLFLAYQRSIERQFEFLSRRWMNSEVAPEGHHGHDVLVGRSSDGQGAQRRWAVIRGAQPTRRAVIAEDWVSPRGGGYFFAASLSALTALAERAH